MKDAMVVDSNGQDTLDRVVVKELTGEVIDNENGTFTILKEVPQPMYKMQFNFDTGEFEETQSDTEKLQRVKQHKLSELYKAYQEEKWSQITSSLIGSDGLNIIFDYKSSNKDDYQGIVSSFAIDPNQTDSIIGSQSHGKFYINRDDMITLKNDMNKHETDLYLKFKDLKTKVENATTMTEVDSVVW